MALKVFDEIVSVGIIGPRPHFIGGHDIDAERRIELKQQIKSILSKLLEQKPKVLVGNTGLGLGAEQDFALACLDLNIDYRCFLPFENQEELWANIPHAQSLYESLLQNSIEHFFINEGSYSPKKILNKNTIIAEKSTLLLLVETDKIVYQENYSDRTIRIHV